MKLGNIREMTKMMRGLGVQRLTMRSTSGEREDSVDATGKNGHAAGCKGATESNDGAFAMSKGRRVRTFFKRWQNRLARMVHRCFRVSEPEKENENPGNNSASEEQQVGMCWSPELDPAILAYAMDATAPAHEQENLPREQDREEEESEWFDSFLEPLSFSRVDDSELLVVLAEEERLEEEAERATWVSESDSLGSITPCSGLGIGTQCMCSCQRDFWRTSRTVKEEKDVVEKRTNLELSSHAAAASNAETLSVEK